MVNQGSAPRTLVMMPCYNERASLCEMLTRIHAAVPEATVLVIDDASPDGTGVIADACAAQHSWVRVLHRPQKLGLGTAYTAGFAWAEAELFDYLVAIDADGSHLPEQLPELLRVAVAGAGLVIGSRWVDGGKIVGWPLSRRVISRVGTGVARVFLRSRLHDITSGFRVFDARWVRQLDLPRIASQGYSFQVEVAWTLERWGCEIAEVPITFVERQTGVSKMSLGIVCEALFRVIGWGWRLRTRPASLPSARRTHREQ